MHLIVGLGNLGKDYNGTKHNVGFAVVDQIIETDTNPQSKINKPLQAEIATTEIAEKKVLLAKPTTFMNNSGVAVQKIISSYDIASQEVLVVHDDIGIELGKIKISQGVGAGKHNGVQSVIDHLGTNDLIRVRLGVGRGNGVLKNVVLSSFKSREEPIVEAMISRAAEACVAIVTQGVERAMNTYNTS